MPTRHSLEGLASSVLTSVATVSNAIGSLVVLVLVVVVNVDVVARGGFNAPFHGAVEVVQYSMVLIVFLQLPDVVRVDRLTRSDGLLMLIGNRAGPVAGLIRRAIDLGAAIMMVLIAVAMWPEFVDAWQTDRFFGTPGIFTAPWWPVRLVIVFSAVMCALIWFAKACLGHQALLSQAENRTAGADG